MWIEVNTHASKQDLREEGRRWSAEALARSIGLYYNEVVTGNDGTG